MTVETTFRALLAGHGPLAALVQDRIAQDAVPEGATYPLVVFSCTHNYTHGLDNVVLADQAALQVQCWAQSGAEAAAVADQVVTAVAGAALQTGAVVLTRSTTFDPDTLLDGIEMAVEWWA